MKWRQDKIVSVRPEYNRKLAIFTTRRLIYLLKLYNFDATCPFPPYAKPEYKSDLNKYLYFGTRQK
jgi:hypothetical protein